MTEERRKQAGHQMQIRFPEGSGLRERLMDLARANNRSLTAEIMYRLEMSMLGVEARLEGSERGIRDVEDLSSDHQDMLWEVIFRLKRLEEHCGIMHAEVPKKGSKPRTRKKL
ncbi:Arc family DNA-binding protein [Mesorhizobium erdmanii]|uniref:Arc family DNA-binding protein n=1 Tax=Mesorhizobium erdmanii TaxID=1777866 RepID=A0A6M7UBS5_9HYPH|nr:MULTISPECIES: Arc family DNA-binding protein [Mesorhizobium]OBQ67792.1 hypothetical protein A8146_10110 [Mesorhizobium loti]QKC74186.1 Arc family DNA-binding protein [Mesorhizobium erdmanii]